MRLLRILDAVSPAISVACILAFAISGVFAVQGSPFDAPVDPVDMDRPGWLDRMVSNGSFPAYYVGPDSVSMPVGRVAIQNSTVRFTPFADKWSGLVGGPGLEGVRVHILPTDVKALWASVPQAAKIELAERSEALARHLQSRIVSIVGSTKFANRYQDVFRAVGSDAYRAIWDDPRYRLIESTLEGLYRPEDGEEVAEVLMPILVPELRRALTETLTPHWDTVRNLVLEGRIDPGPFREAAGRVLMNEQLQEAVLDVVKRTASNPRIWRVMALLTDIYIDNLTSDPRFETLVSDLVEDPAFASDMREIEVELTEYSTTLFDLVVERGDQEVPDVLAMRMLRYILLNRISAVAIVMADNDPQAPFLERYRVRQVAP